jgi:hypothetical protein
VVAVDLDTLPKGNAPSVYFFSWTYNWHDAASALSDLLGSFLQRVGINACPVVPK